MGRFTLKAAGVVFSESFGSVKNAVPVQYRYRVNGELSWPGWQSMSVSGEQNYTATASLTGLDPHATYEFQVRATDKLSTTESAMKVINTIPMARVKDGTIDFGFTILQLGVSLLDLAHPVGSVIISNKNENPGGTIGGTWSSGSSLGSGLYTWVRTA